MTGGRGGGAPPRGGGDGQRVVTANRTVIQGNQPLVKQQPQQRNVVMSPQQPTPQV